MAEELTLEELKAQNAAEEEPAAPETEDTEEFLEADTDDGEGTEDPGEGEPEAFLANDEQGVESGDGEARFTSSDVAAAKRKLKGRLGDAKDRVAELEEENQRLRQVSQAAPSGDAGKPKREDFLDVAGVEDADAYTEALMDWKVNARQHTEDRRVSVATAKQAITQQVDRHYESAGKMIQEHGISEEVYANADKAFRSSIEEVLPGKGDVVADALIASLGDGSDKATFYLGRNAAKLAEFRSRLVSDPSGISAAIYLGEVKNSVLSPKKSVRKPPTPAKQIKGDAPQGETSQSRKLVKQYQAAHTKGNHQAAYNAKKAARAAGVDVSTW